MRRALLATLLALLGAATVLGAEGASRETFYLDAQAVGSGDPAVVSETVLEPGRQRHTLVVSGTLSIWPKLAWEKGKGCGAPDPFPQTPSPGRENGPTGLDAEVVFAMAAPRPYATCASEALPRRAAEVYEARGLFIDTGSGLSRLIPRGGAPTVPTAAHTYVYDVYGEGQPLEVRYRARQGDDDYGVLTLTLSADTPVGAGPLAAPTAVPPVVTTPAPVPTPGPRAGCKQRYLRVQFRNRRTRRLLRGTALFAGRHRTLRRVRTGLRGRLNVRRLGRQRLAVKVVARTKAGRTVVIKRRYRICGR